MKPSFNKHFMKEIKVNLFSRYFLVGFLLLFSHLVFSQGSSVNINVQILPPYSPYLSDYIGFKEKVVITLTNTTGNTQNIYLKAKLTSNTGFLAMTSDDYIPNSPIILNPNATIQLAGNNQLLDFFNENNIDVDYGDYTLQNILTDGVLPDGTYTLCVDAFNFDDDEQLNIPNLGCRSFQISYLTPPQLIKPSCSENSTVIKNEIQNIDFVWLPVNSSVPGIQFRYDLYIVKLNENDNPQDLIEMGIAANSSNILAFKDIPINSYNLNFSNPIKLELGKYAWAVKARVFNGDYPMVNDGLSPVCTFEMIPGEMKFLNNNDFSFDPVCDCKAVLPINLANVNPNQLQNGSKIQTSNYEMEVNTISHQGGLYSGDGYIKLPILNVNFLKVKVQFKDISIKSDGDNFIHTAGTIKAMVRGDAASLMPTMDGINPGQLQMGPVQTQALSTYFEQYGEQLISDIKTKVNTTAFLLPLGLDEKVMKIAIVNMVFSPDQAYFDAAAVLDIIDGNSKVGLIGQGICMDNNDFCGNAKLYLSQDFEIPFIGMKLIGGNPLDATSVTFDKKGFKNLRISAEYTFPEGSLIDVNTKRAASVTLSCETEDGWSDWIADVKFNPFYISGFEDIKFGPDDNNTSMYYDHSDKKNPAGIPSPYKNSDDTDQIDTHLPTWRGFYIPSIGLTLPAAFSSEGGNPIVVKAEKLIFDGGLSGNVSINNILEIGKGSLDGWYYSIDRFQIDIWKNSFKQSSLKGKVVLPVSNAHTNTTNQLDYTCTLSKPTQGGLDFEFKIFPANKIDFDIFWASGQIEQSSSIQIFRKNDGTFGAKAELYGKLTLQTEIDDFPEIKLAEVHFRKLTFRTAAPHFSPGETQATFFGLSSPQHSIAGFVIDLDASQGRGVSLDASKLGESKIGIKFKALLKLVADVDFVPKAEVEFSVFGKFGMKDGRPDWKGFDADINKIKLEAGAKIGPVGVEGTLGYYNDNNKPNANYGFFGSLIMNIDKLITIEAKAQFGYQKENNGGYNYFFIDAMADLGEAGIPIPPSMAIYGFMGGVYYNMGIADVTLLNNTDIQGSPKYVHDYDNPQPGVTLSGLTYVPEKGFFSLKAGILFGLKTRAILDADGSLTATINTQSGGLHEIIFELHGRFITNMKEPLAQRKANCMGKGDIVMKMNFTEKSFLFHLGLTLGVPSHSNADLLYASAHINFYSGPTGWFVHVGRPWTTAGDEWGNNIGGGNPIQLKILGIRFMGYFQCGEGTGEVYENGQFVKGVNALDPIPPIPNFIMSIINRSDNTNGENGYANSNRNLYTEKQSITGGLAFGANFTVGMDINFLIFYMKTTFMAGFDLAFVNKNGAKCQKSDGSTVTMGANGFYAAGQAYLGAKIDVGIEVDLFFFSGKISIVEAGVGAMVQFGAPNPSFVTGAIGGYFSVLGGIIEGSFAVKFYWGEECTELSDESLPLIAEINPVADFDENNFKKRINVSELQPIFVQPSATFNYEIDKTFLIIIPVADPDNPGYTYREYRYYHILPKDITVNLSGFEITQNGVPYTEPLTMADFKITNDNFNIVPNEEISFHKESDYFFDVKAQVRIFNLRTNSKNQAGGRSGYKNDDSDLKGVNNFVRDQWDLAKDKTQNTFTDERHIKFTTDCGIKYIENIWIDEVTPFHRSQNNPLSHSSKVKESDLRKSESSGNSSFAPVFNTNKNSLRTKNVIRRINAQVSNNGHNITVVTNKDFFDESKLCIPKDYAQNFDFNIRISSINKAAQGSTFKKDYYKVSPSADKSSFSLDLGSPLPANSFIIVQVIVKKRKSITQNNSDIKASTVVKKNFTGMINDSFYNVNINQKTVPLESKLTGSASEMEIFRWYFTTGEYNTYQDKMAAMEITVDTITTEKSFYSSMNKGGYKLEKFKYIESTFNFKGYEKFDFHDLQNHYIVDVFEGGNRKIMFDKKLEEGILGFAFDNKSQELVDQFLRTYFTDKEVMTKFLNLGKNGDNLYENEMSTFINNYITEKMLDATRWAINNHIGQVLPPLANIPANVSYNSSMFNKSYKFNNATTMFSIKRIQKVLKSQGSSTKIIPAHIITMKNFMDNMPDHNPIFTFSIMTDMMNDFNNNIQGNVVNGFNPGIINVKNKLKR
ncbi:MAG: hypothetical protein IPL20_16965 [Saprospiraceae bacterium]|nr:hypothetical protein [Saprospiraceae bacterium]